MDRYYEDDGDSLRSLPYLGSIASVRSDGSSSDGDGESSSSGENAEMVFRNEWQRITDNNPNQTSIEMYGDVFIMTEADWEQFGRDISNNTHLTDLTLCDGALNDHKMSCLFRGLTGSNSIRAIDFTSLQSLRRNDFGVEGVRSMVPFLQNASNLTKIDFDGSYIGSEGFALLMRALSDSPIESLHCFNCGVESIEIDGDNIPKKLTKLVLSENNINTDGCRELAKLLLGADSTLTTLALSDSRIGDEGVKILANALQNNTSLEILELEYNESISNEGHVSLLKLVNDVSSIKATLQSNHTLREISVFDNEEIQQQINGATLINRMNKGNPEAAGREKVIRTQLNSVTRAKLADLQGVHRSLYSEIDPLHLPEVLALVDTYHGGSRDHIHGQRELYVALKSSIMTLFSTVNEKKCIEQEREYHATKEAEHRAKKEELDAKLAAMEGVQGNDVDGESERSNKRRRTWFWGLWGG